MFIHKVLYTTYISQIIPPELISLIYTVIYLAIIGVIISFIYGIAELFSRDRVIKIFEGKYAFVFIGNEAYYGKIRVPPRSGGGFEILFPPEGIENPESLLAFLIENYRETQDEKFLKEATQLLDDFKKRGLLPKDYTLDKIKINPWAPPSLVSRKIFKQELGNLYAILIFRHVLSKEELKERWRELRRLYHPPFFSRVKRKIYNSLAYVKDKISGAVTKSTGVFTAMLTPEMRVSIEDLERRALATLGAIYDALLENSIGRLITVQVQDIDGETKLYQGVLREYSNNYIAIYDVDYRIQMITKFKGEEQEKGYPKPTLKFHGWMFRTDIHLAIKEIKFNNGNISLKIENISKDPIRIEKIKIDGNEVSIFSTLFPGESTVINSKASSERPDIEVLYEISKEADIIWPRAKVKILGLGDYPPVLLSNILSLRKIVKI